MLTDLTASEFERRLIELRPEDALRGKSRDPQRDVDRRSNESSFIGIKMGAIFKLGKEFAQMPVEEIEKLMESPVHKVRVGALSIMGQCAKGKNCSAARLKALYE